MKTFKLKKYPAAFKPFRNMKDIGAHASTATLYPIAEGAFLIGKGALDTVGHSIAATANTISNCATCNAYDIPVIAPVKKAAIGIANIGVGLAMVGTGTVIGPTLLVTRIAGTLFYKGGKVCTKISGKKTTKNNEVSAKNIEDVIAYTSEESEVSTSLDKP